MTMQTWGINLLFDIPIHLTKAKVIPMEAPQARTRTIRYHRHHVCKHIYIHILLCECCVWIRNCTQSTCARTHARPLTVCRLYVIKLNAVCLETTEPFTQWRSDGPCCPSDWESGFLPSLSPPSSAAPPSILLPGASSLPCKAEYMSTDKTQLNWTQLDSL